MLLASGLQRMMSILDLSEWIPVCWDIARPCGAVSDLDIGGRDVTCWHSGWHVLTMLRLSVLKYKLPQRPVHSLSLYVVSVVLYIIILRDNRKYCSQNHEKWFVFTD